MGSRLITLLGNECLWAAVLAWLMAQFTKMLCALAETRRLDFGYLVSTGGMPSAHTALICGLATAVGLQAGFDTAVFAVACVLALIVMFDASTVRRAAGMQAQLLNEIIDELFKEHHLSERKLAELLGHTRIEIFVGLVLGILVALLVHAAATL